MRLLAAMFSHETNTFSTRPTGRADFCFGEPFPLTGERATQRFRGTGKSIAAFIDSAERAKAELHIGFVADALPGGRVTADCFDFFADLLLEQIDTLRPDGLLLSLHGAMVSEAHDDAEGELLSRVRRVFPDLMIGVVLDMHANLTAEMVTLCDAVTSYRTYPHLDMYEAGARAAKIVIDALRTRRRPVTRMKRLPLLPPLMSQGTYRSPNRELQEAAHQVEARSGILAACVLMGFPYSDVAAPGVSVVVTAQPDCRETELALNELADMAWRSRDAFSFPVESLDRSMSDADRLSRQGPVVLLDHADTSWSGCDMRSTAVLKAALRHGCGDIAVFALCAPELVRRVIDGGVGTSSTLANDGLVFNGRTTAIEHLRFVSDSPASPPGVIIDAGYAVTISDGSTDIVLVSKRVECTDMALLTRMGIDPTRKRFLLIKSRIAWRGGFPAFLERVVPCDGGGIGTSRLHPSLYSKLRRPIHPFDPDDAFE